MQGMKTVFCYIGYDLPNAGHNFSGLPFLENKRRTIGRLTFFFSDVCIIIESHITKELDEGFPLPF